MYYTQDDIKIHKQVVSPIQIGKKLKEYKTLQMEKLVEETIRLFSLPDVIKNIKPFEGDRNSVYHFINNVDSILSLCEKIKEAEYYKIIISGIRNKVVGKASDILLTQNINDSSWEAIKQALILNFADKRDESTLTFQLHNLVRSNLNHNDLYNKITEIISLLSNQLKLQKLEQCIVDAKIKLYLQMGLTIFMGGIKEPLGQWLRARRPETLAEALEFVNQEENIQRIKNPPQPSKKNSYNWRFKNNGEQPSTSHNFSTRNIRPPSSQNYSPQNNFKSTSNNYPPRNNYTPNNYPIKQEAKVEPKKPYKQVHYNIESQTIDDEDFQQEASDN